MDTNQDARIIRVRMRQVIQKFSRVLFRGMTGLGSSLKNPFPNPTSPTGGKGPEVRGGCCSKGFSVLSLSSPPALNHQGRLRCLRKLPKEANWQPLGRDFQKRLSMPEDQTVLGALKHLVIIPSSLPKRSSAPGRKEHDFHRTARCCQHYLSSDDEL